MVGKTQICNMALAHCGINSRIQNVDSDTSNNAVQCRLFYDVCREALLEMRPWAFAKRRFTLTNLGTPPDEWAYRYKYPAVAKRVNKIINPYARTPGRGQKIPFEIEDNVDGLGKVILTDQQDAIISYNKDVTNPELFSGSFVFGLSMMIAVYISMPLRVNPKITAYQNEQFGFWLQEAATHDMREQQEDEEPSSDLQTVRY